MIWKACPLSKVLQHKFRKKKRISSLHSYPSTGKKKEMLPSYQKSSLRMYVFFLCFLRHRKYHITINNLSSVTLFTLKTVHACPPNFEVSCPTFKCRMRRFANSLQRFARQMFQHSDRMFEQILQISFKISFGA